MSTRAGGAGLVAAAAVAAALGLVGGASATLPSPPLAPESPVYSPGGTHIAYAVRHVGGSRGWLVVARANGSGLRSVYTSTDGCCDQVGWASSERLVFDDDYQLKSVDIQTGKLTDLATGAAYFRFSPNRETVAIAEGCECNHAPDAVALVGVDGRGYRLVAKPKNATDELDGFSPDGTQLVFTRYPYTYDDPATNKPSLYAVSVKGGAPVPISKSALIGTSHLPGDANSISWSTDGRWLSFFTPKGLWLLNTSTGTAKLVVSARGAGSPWSRAIGWSATSSELAYAGAFPFGKRTKAGQPLVARLVIVTAGGARRELWSSSLTYLTDTPGELPQWSPDGKSLIFLARPAGSRAWAKVYVVSADAHGLRRIGSQAAASIPICQSRHLRLRASFYGEAGGQFIQTFTATNAGTRCRLAGWPTLGLRDASGQAHAAPSIRVVQGRTSSHPFNTVTLQPGGAASFDVFGADYNAAANRACPKTDALLVSLPGVEPLPATVALPNCGAFYIAPLIAGRTDHDSWSTVWAKRWCRIQQFNVTIGPRISEATGQHTLALRLTNHGSSCTLFGFPALWFEDAHGRIPFQLHTGGDQMITTTTALPVQVRTGGSSWVVVNHYRCDLGDKRAASTVRIGLGGAVYTDTVSVTIPDPYEHLAYCGRGDPGSTVTIAPFEPKLTSAFRH